MGAHRVASRNVAIALTMIVAGVWHGTTLSFLLFGLVHAVYQIVYRTSEHLLTARLGAQRVRALRSSWNWTVASTALTFVATASAYIFFLLTPAQLMLLLTTIRSRL
jgi:D-alanyl-lipoteichoic acid acyltransferase DltB (MBOAT superfamily)